MEVGSEQGKDNEDTCDQEILDFFIECSKKLDSHHDRYERLVKLSRDITIESKRVIFLLHRIQDESTKEKLVKEADSKLQFLVTTSWNKVAKELLNQDHYHYLRAYSPGLWHNSYHSIIEIISNQPLPLFYKGLQEFIEALSFLNYVKLGQLISLTYIQSKLTYSETLVVTIPVQEYLLGIADLTGELMRMCINAVGRGQTALVSNTCCSLRKIHEALASLR